MQQEDDQSLPRIVSQREGPSDDGTGGAGRRPAAPLRCKVENCDANLESAPKTHQRFRLCNDHIKAPVISVDGVAQRFCQQCSRFHPLSEFDGLNRTCRMMLAKNRARQRNHAQRQTSLQGPAFLMSGSAGANLPWDQLSDIRSLGGGDGGSGFPGAGVSLPMAGGGFGTCVFPRGPGGRHPIDLGLGMFGSGLHRSFDGLRDMQEQPVQVPESWLATPARLNTSAGGTRALHPGLSRQGGFQTAASALQLHHDVDADHAALQSSSRGAGCDGGGGGNSGGGGGGGGNSGGGGGDGDMAAESGERDACRSGRQRTRRSRASRRDGVVVVGGGGDSDSDGGSSEGSSSGSSDELIKAAAAAGATVNQIQPGATSAEVAPRELLVGPPNRKQSMELGLTPALGPGKGFTGPSGYVGGVLRRQQGGASAVPSITTLAMQATAATPGSPADAAVRASRGAAVALADAAATAGWDSGFGERVVNDPLLGRRSGGGGIQLGLGGRHLGALLQPNTGPTIWAESAPIKDDGGAIQMLRARPSALMGIGSGDVVMADSDSIRPRSRSSTGAGAGTLPPGPRLLLLEPVRSRPPVITGPRAGNSGGRGITGDGGGGGGSSKRRRHRASAGAAEAAQTQTCNLQDPIPASPFKVDGSQLGSPPQLHQPHHHNWQQQQLLMMQRQVQQMRQQLQIQQVLGPGNSFLPAGLAAKADVEPGPHQYDTNSIRTGLMRFGSGLADDDDGGVGTRLWLAGKQAEAQQPGGAQVCVPEFGSAASVRNGDGDDSGRGGSASAIPPVGPSAAAGAAAAPCGPNAAGGDSAGVSPAPRLGGPTADKTRSPAVAAGLVGPISPQSPECILSPLVDVFEQVDAGVDVDMLLMGTDEGDGMSDSGGLPTVPGVGLTFGFAEGLGSSSGAGLACNELAALAAEWSQDLPDCPNEAGRVALPSQLDLLPSQVMSHQALPLLLPPPAQRPSFPGAAMTRVSIPPAFNRVSDESSLIAAGTGAFSSGQFAAEAAIEAAAAIISGGNGCGGGGGGTQQPFLRSPMWSPGNQRQQQPQSQSQRRLQPQSILASSLASQASGGAGEVMSRPSDALALSPMILSADMGGGSGGGGGGTGARDGGSSGTLADATVHPGLQVDGLKMSGGNMNMRFQPRAMQQQQQLLMQQTRQQQQQQQQQRTAPAALVSGCYPPGFAQGPVTAVRPSDLAVGTSTPSISTYEQLQQLQKHIQELQQQLQIQQQQLQQHLQKQIQLQQQQQNLGQPVWHAQQQSASLGQDTASPVPPLYLTPQQQQQRRWPLMQLGTWEPPGETSPMVLCSKSGEPAPEPTDPGGDPFRGAAITSRRPRASLQPQQPLPMRTAGMETAVADDPLGKSLRLCQFTGGGGGSTAVNQARAQADGNISPGAGNSAQLTGCGRGSAGSFSWAQLLPPPPLQMFGADTVTFIPPLRGGSGAAAVSSSTETSGGDHRSVTNAHQAISGGVSSDNSSRGSALATRGGLQQQQQQCDVTDAAAWALQQQLMLQVSETFQMLQTQSVRPAGVPQPATQAVLSGALASSPAAGLLHAPGLAFSSMAAMPPASDIGGGTAAAAPPGSAYVGQLGRVPELLLGPGLVASAAREGAPQSAVPVIRPTNTQEAIYSKTGDTDGGGI